MSSGEGARPPFHGSELPHRNDLTPESLRRFAHDAVDWMVDYLSSFDDAQDLKPREPARDVFERFRQPMPEEGSSPSAVLESFRREIVPRATRLQHPGNLAYIPNSAGIVGIVADLLASTLNQNVSLVRGGPSAAAVEAQVVSWLQALLGYPEDGGGVLTSGGSLANLMGLGLARRRAGGGEVDNLVFYASSETHSSIERALGFLGVRPDALRSVATDDGYRMRPDALERAMAEDRAAGRRPAAVVATAGTIGSGAVDPLEEIADVCRSDDVWLHVDGAYGALAAAARSGSWMRAGLARADSVSLDPHKWLFVPIDTSCLLVRDPAAMRRAFTVVPEYLKVSASESSVHQPMEHTLELTRRFRALRIWMVLQAYGARAIRERIEEHLSLARRLGAWIEADPRFELAAPVMTSTVTFRFVPENRPGDDELDRLNERIFERLEAERGLFVSRNRLRGRFTLRACITHLRTREEHVRRFWEACRGIARDEARASG